MPRCRQLFAEIAGRRSARRVRLLTSRLAKQPFASLGVAVQVWRRAVIVLPESLCDDEQAARWALAHEWTQIKQGDFRAGFVAGLARVLFFYQPLVWWLRRQLRLCQDYVADARASRQASQPEDYAEFLIDRAAAGSLHPATIGLGMGFSKGKSDLCWHFAILQLPILHVSLKCCGISCLKSQNSRELIYSLRLTFILFTIAGFHFGLGIG